MDVFSSKYKVQTEFTLHVDLLLWVMTLEERKGRKKHVKTPRGGKETVDEPPRVTIYKVSRRESLLLSIYKKVEKGKTCIDWTGWLREC